MNNDIYPSTIYNKFGSKFRKGDKSEYDLSELNSRIEQLLNGSKNNDLWFKNLFYNCARESHKFLENSPEYVNMSEQNKSEHKNLIQVIETFNFNEITNGDCKLNLSIDNTLNRVKLIRQTINSTLTTFHKISF